MSQFFTGTRNITMDGDPTFNGFAGNQYNYYHSLGRPINHYITADNDDEEAEYAQFADIKRSNFLPQENIHHDYEYWHDLGQVACERMLKKGTVRTEHGVESQCIAVLYSGDKVKEAWKRDFQQFSGIPSVEMVHMVGINRTKIPFLVLEGDLVPLSHFLDNQSEIVQMYLKTLVAQLGCQSASELWMDNSRGVFCRGPEGPLTEIVSDDFRVHNSFRSDTALIKDDVLVQYLSKLNADRAFDQDFIVGLFWSCTVEKATMVAEYPSVVYDLTNTTLAEAFGMWLDRSEEGTLSEPRVSKGLTTFKLEPNAHHIKLELDFSLQMCAWLAQSLSIFHELGISLDNDLSAYKLRMPDTLEATLLPSEFRKSWRCPIYLCIPPLSSSIFWSFDKRGRDRIPDNFCIRLGLPLELSLTCLQYSCTTQTYKLLRQYQIGRGFDPNTTDFAERRKFWPFFDIVAMEAPPSRVEEVKEGATSMRKLVSSISKLILPPFSGSATEDADIPIMIF